MKRTGPRGRWWRPGLIAGLSLLAAVLAVGLVSGPRYQGRGVNHWFARWDMAGEVDGREDPRLTELAAAGPEVVPLLVSALTVEDRLPGRLYNALREDLPRGRRSHPGPASSRAPASSPAARRLPRRSTSASGKRSR